MRVQELLDLLYDQIDNSPKALIGSKRMVDPDVFIQIISDIKKALPIELDRAVNIIKERKQIMYDAEKEADQLINEARRHADELVSQTEVIKRAQQEAKNIVEQARQHSREIRQATMNFSERMFEELEYNAKAFIAQIQKNKEQLNAQFPNNE